MLSVHRSTFSISYKMELVSSPTSLCSSMEDMHLSVQMIARQQKSLHFIQKVWASILVAKTSHSCDSCFKAAVRLIVVLTNGNLTIPHGGDC